MASATLYIESKKILWEVEVQIDGKVQSGGSNSHGSDEPAWVAAEVNAITLANGKPMPRRMRDALTAADWEYLEDTLIENWG